MAEEKKTLYTEEGFKVLSDELDYLKNTKIQEVKEALKEARAFGDLSENSEYDEAKNEQAKVVSRIAELEELISNPQAVQKYKSEASQYILSRYNWNNVTQKTLALYKGE